VDCRYSLSVANLTSKSGEFPFLGADLIAKSFDLSPYKKTPSNSILHHWLLDEKKHAFWENSAAEEIFLQKCGNFHG